MAKVAKANSNPKHGAGGFAKKCGRTWAPDLNDWDLPELAMPANTKQVRPRANPSNHREYFESRCKQVWRDIEMRDPTVNTREEDNRARKVEKDMETLSAMFPGLEPTLVQAIYFDVKGNSQAAVEQLLPLSSAALKQQIQPVQPTDERMAAEEAEEAIEAEDEEDGFTFVEASDAIEADVALKDEGRRVTIPSTTQTEEAWPSLTLADGWQTVSMKELEEDSEKKTNEKDSEGNRTLWRDRAFAAKALPEPVPKLVRLTEEEGAAPLSDVSMAQSEENSEGEEYWDHELDVMSEFDWRKHLGQRRASRDAKAKEAQREARVLAGTKTPTASAAYHGPVKKVRTLLNAGTKLEKSEVGKEAKGNNTTQKKGKEESRCRRTAARQSDEKAPISASPKTEKKTPEPEDNGECDAW